MGSIYKITNIVNGKSYIGQTYRDVETRVFKEHLRGHPSNCRLLSNAVKKHGANNFTMKYYMTVLYLIFLMTLSVKRLKSSIQLLHTDIT